MCFPVSQRMAACAIHVLVLVVSGWPARAPANAPSQPAPGPESESSLLVSADLPCNWKLDGIEQGRLTPGSPATAKVAAGKHIVQASTLDGLDTWQLTIDINPHEGKAVAIALADVREQRLQEEQQKKQQAQWEQDRQAAEQQRQQAERERQAMVQRQQARAQPVWQDPATGLTWAHKDNGADMDWNEAITYCQKLSLGGQAGWRLPGIDELQAIHDPKAAPAAFSFNGQKSEYRIEGDITLGGEPWSATQKNFKEAWLFSFVSGARDSSRFSDSANHRALCVRRGAR